MICELKSLTFADSEVRTVRIPQVWKYRLAWSRPAARFWGQNKLVEDKDFYFYYSMFEKIFSGHNKIWRAQKNLGTLPLKDPMATGLA